MTAIPGANDPFDFNGPEYDAEHDRARLTGQILRVFEVMKTGHWRTLSEISSLTGHNDPQASVSAQLRHLRKKRFGSHTVLRRSRGDRSLGLYEYCLIVHDPDDPPTEDPTHEAQ